MELSGINNYY